MSEPSWTFNPQENRLVRGLRIVPISPKTAAVLKCLLAHKGSFVSRETLLREAWPGLNVTPDLVREHVFHIRSALGDDARSPRYIETLRGKGFRYLGGIELNLPNAPITYVPSEEPQSASTDNLDLGRSGAVEHRTVTALFCARAKLPTLTDQTSHEAALDLTEQVLSRADGIVVNYEGKIVKWLENGFLALFGAPTTHEDDARRAVLASFDLDRDLNRNLASDGDTLLGEGQRLSIGLDTGMLAVSSLAIVQETRNFTARGLIIDRAKLLQSRAGPGTILASDSTYRCVASEIDAERWKAEGIDAPVYALGGILCRRAGVPRRAVAQDVPFVGRQEELAVLRERFDRACAHDPTVTSVTGAAGIGKSRLLEVFRASLAGEEATFIEAPCFPHGAPTPYALIGKLGRDLCGISPGDDCATAEAKARTALERSGISWTAHPALTDLLGLPTAPERRAQLSPQARRAEAFAAMDALVLGEASRQPVVLLFEDLHWIDATSEDWLSELIVALGEAALLVLATYRPEYSPNWDCRAPVTRLVLPTLTDRDSKELVRTILEPADFAPEIVESIVTKSGGNPFFLIEMGHAARNGRDVGQDSALPHTIQSVVMSRVDQLKEPERRILQFCSVIGDEIPRDLLYEISGVEGLALDAALTSLQMGQFLGRARATGTGRYRFRHAIIEDAIYNRLSLEVRARLHRRIAAALEINYPHLIDQNPEIIARHHEGSGDAVAAIPYWRRAARRAYQRSANIEAIKYARHGLALIERAGCDEIRTREELGLLLTIAPALVAVQGYGTDELRPLYARATRLCERSDDVARLFRTLIGSWNFHWVRGELDLAHEQASKLLHHAPPEGGAARALRSHAAMGEILFHMGRLDASVHNLQTAIFVSEAEPLVSMSTQIPKVACLCYAAWGLFHVGQAQQSLKRAQEASALAATLQHPLSAALCTALIAELHQYRMDVVPCFDAAQRAIAISEEQHFPFWQGTAMVLSGWAQCMNGSFENGERTMKEGITIFSDTGARIQQPTWLGMLAEVYNRVGRRDEGLRCVEEALDWTRKTGEQHYLSELHRLNGDLLGSDGTAAGDVAAEQAYVRAIDVACAQSAQIRERRARRGLARLLDRLGRADEPRTAQTANASADVLPWRKR